MNSKRPVGWRREPARHALASKGVKTAPVRGRAQAFGGRILVLDGVEYTIYNYPHDRTKYVVAEEDPLFLLIFGSDTRTPSGTRHYYAKKGDVLYYDGGAPDGTQWFFLNGERCKHDSNGWVPYMDRILKEVPYDKRLETRTR